MLHANLVRSFVHVEIRAHAVARAVHVVKSVAPEVAAGNGVDLRARGRTGELAHLKLDVALKHEGVDEALLVGDGAEGYCARDVGRSVKILPARVYQDEALWTQAGVRLRRGLIMNDGPVLLICQMVSNDGPR